MQQENLSNKQTANYLQAESEAKELLIIAPTVTPNLPNYGGEQVPKAMVIVQNYSVTRTETSATDEFKEVRQQMKDVTGKLKFDLVPVNGTDGKQKVDSNGSKIFKRVPVMSNEMKWQRIRTRGNSNTTQTLNVLPCKILAHGKKLSDVLACGLDDLKKAITTGKPVNIAKVVNGEKKQIVINVKKAIRKNSLCHVFVRIGDKVLSTVMVHGGVKGSELYNDFHGAASAMYQQLKQAETDSDGKPLEIDSSILTALGLTKK